MRLENEDVLLRWQYFITRASSSRSKLTDCLTAF